MSKDVQGTPGWKQVRLGDIADVVGGGTPKSDISELWNGDIAWATPTDVTELSGFDIRTTKRTISQLGLQSSNATLLPPNSVLVTSRATVGYVAINTIPMATNQGFVNLIPKLNENRTDTLFLAYLLENRRGELHRLAAGSTFLEVSRSSVQKMHIQYPPPSERYRIAQLLASIDGALEASKAVLEQIKSAKEGVLQHLFAYGTGNLKNSDQHLPHAWELLNLNKLGKGQVVRTGPFGSSLKTEHFSATGTPVITIGSLGEGVIEREALMYVPDAKAKELEAYKVKEGDLVFSRVADVGRSVRIGRDEADWLMSSNLIRIRVDLSRFNAQFLMYAITRSSFLGRQIKRLTSGGGRAVVTSAVLSELMFATPMLEEQNEIVSILDSFDEDYHALEAKCCQLDILKRALMQQLLTGKLRVAVDDG